MALAKAAKDSDTTLIIPNAGADAITGPLCSKGIFRTSFTNWQPSYAMGPVALEKGYKTAVRSEEHTSELQSLMRISYAVFCLKQKKTPKNKLKLHTVNKPEHT